MSAEAVAAVLAGLGAAATTLVTLLIAFLSARHKNRQEADRTALEQYREVADRLQRQVERLDGHVRDLTDAFGELSEEHASCQVEMAGLYGELVRLHDFARRVAGVCRRLGDDPGEPPPLPPRPERPDRSAAEHRRRTLAQTSQNLHALSGVIPPGKPLGPGAP